MYRNTAGTMSQDVASIRSAAFGDAADIAAMRSHEATASGKVSAAATAAANALSSYNAADTINTADMATAIANINGFFTAC